MAQYQIPGDVFVDAGGGHQYQIPGAVFIDDGSGGGAGPGTLKIANTVVRASIKTLNALALASVKTANTLT